MNANALARVLRGVGVIAIVSLNAATPVSVHAQALYVPTRTLPAPLGGARVTGKITAIAGHALRLRLRDDRTIVVDLQPAEAQGMAPPVYIGEVLQVQGRLASDGGMTAVAISHAKSAPAAWMPDTP